MSFKEKIQNFIVQIKIRKEHIENEEMTKQALIIPFIQLLGYDVFNPLEVKPEYSADFGTKKGEKVDYAICKDNKPIIFVEAKPVINKLDKSIAQLSRYFNSTPSVKLGILTNGLQYLFFTDLTENNIMDYSPFYEVDLEKFNDSDLDILNIIKKDTYTNESLIDFGESSMYLSKLQASITELINEPSDQFIKFLIKDYIKTRLTTPVIERFKPIVKKAIQNSLSDICYVESKNENKIIEITLNKQKNLKKSESKSIEKNECIKEVYIEKIEPVETKSLELSENQVIVYERIQSILEENCKDISNLNYNLDSNNQNIIIYNKNPDNWLLKINCNDKPYWFSSKLSLPDSKALAIYFQPQECIFYPGATRINITNLDNFNNLKTIVVKAFEISETL